MCRFKDLTGQKFGRLTVLKYIKSTKTGKPIWLCECDCGNKKEILGESLLSGNTRSCGCIYKEILLRENNKNFVQNTNVAILDSLLKSNISKVTKSGVKGVGWDKKRGKWRAYIMLQKKYYHLGYFADIEKAIEARKEAEEKLFKNFLDGLTKRG